MSGDLDAVDAVLDAEISAVLAGRDLTGELDRLTFAAARSLARSDWRAVEADLGAALDLARRVSHPTGDGLARALVGVRVVRRVRRGEVAELAAELARLEVLAVLEAAPAPPAAWWAALEGGDGGDLAAEIGVRLTLDEIRLARDLAALMARPVSEDVREALEGARAALAALR